MSQAETQGTMAGVEADTMLVGMTGMTLAQALDGRQEESEGLAKSNSFKQLLQEASTKHPVLPPGFVDRRVERDRNGNIKWRMEMGLPDVGGLGWRSKDGHLLKNQTYYCGGPADNGNMWNNPNHAGIHTWRDYHGPKLRTDAPLMERLDRLDADQADWEAKKMFVNTSRLQTLDRFYNQKVGNSQKAIAAAWAPHRRSKKEYHRNFESFDAELDSMPMKELKKVMRPRILKNDREACRAIARRIQVEETWKQAWKHMEIERRGEIRDSLHQRMAYQDMLQEIAGQPNFRQTDPTIRRLPNKCSPRVEELRQHKPAATVDITQLSDFRGLIHVENAIGLEARFPGQGYQMSMQFRQKVVESSTPGWPPPRRPSTPDLAPRVGTVIKPEDNITVRKAAIPVSQDRMDKVAIRTDDDKDLLYQCRTQISATIAPPAPEQKDTVLKQDLRTLRNVNLVQKSGTTMAMSTSQGTSASGLGELLPPPTRSMTYNVVVPAAAEKFQSAARKSRLIRALGGTGSARSGLSGTGTRCLGLSLSAREAGASSSDGSPCAASPRLRPVDNSDELGVTVASADLVTPTVVEEDEEQPEAPQDPEDAFMPTALSSTIRMPNSARTARQLHDTSMRGVCDDMDDFEASLRPQPIIGNFWSTPREDRGFD